MRRSLLPIILCTLLPTIANADLNLEVSAQDGQAVLHVGVADIDQQEYVGWTVTRRIIGTCGDPEPVFDGPLPFPLVMDVANDLGMADTTLTCALPQEDVLYLFEAKLIDAQGQWVTPANEFHWPPLEARDYLGYGDCILFRGSLLTMSYSGTFCDVYISRCTDGCWGSSDPLMLTTVAWEDPLLQYLWQGGVVDVYGVPVEADGMLHVGAYEIDRVEPAPDGACAALAAEAQSFDSFKALFR